MDPPDGKPVSIRDIAKAAGVSITTVSHALSGKRQVTDRTRRRVLEAAERLGYRANAQARALRMGRSLTIAIQIAGGDDEVALPDVAYFIDLLNGASSEALRHGYALVLAPPSASPEQVGNLQVDGAIVVDPTGAEASLTQPGMHVVTTGRVPPHLPDRPWVDNDFKAGAIRVLEHVRQAGYERPALLATSAPQSYVADAVEGYKEWCGDHGLPPLVARTTGPPNETTAADVALELLTRKDRPDAIHATLERLAVGVVIAAERLGIAIPEELGVTAGTDAPSLESFRPAVTALYLDGERIGLEAARLLIELIDGDASGRRNVVVDTELRVRSSTRRVGAAALRRRA